MRPSARSRFFPQRSAGPTRSSYFGPRRTVVANRQGRGEAAEEDVAGVGRRSVPSGMVQNDTGVAGGDGYSENRKVRRARERRRKRGARKRSCGGLRGSENAVGTACVVSLVESGPSGADIKPPEKARKDSSGGWKLSAFEGDSIQGAGIEDQAPDHILYEAESAPLTGISKMGGEEWIQSPITDVPVGDEPSHKPPPPLPPPPASMKRKRSSTVEIVTANCAGSVCIGPQHTSDEIFGVQSEQPGNQQGKQDPHRDTLTRGGREDTPRDFIVKELRTRNIIIPNKSKERALQRYRKNSTPTNGAQLGGATSAQPRGKDNPASTLGNNTIPGEVCPDLAEQVPDVEKETPVQSVRRSPRKRMKRTGKVSSYFSSSSVVKQARRIRKEQIKCRKARVPAGVSVIPQPPLTAKTFGLIQEELENNAYYVIVAAVFLTKTRGATAVPLLRQFLIDYPSPMALSQGNLETLTAFLRPLGLHHVRANRLIQMGKTWIEQPPTPGVGIKKCNYPARDTHPFDFPCPLGGVSGQPRLGVENNCVWEIAHLPGVGAYALDSWRIFCLDRFRQDAAELREREREGEEEEHEEDGGREWMRVVPKDKELRAYLRWRWAKEGWAECEQLAK